MDLFFTDYFNHVLLWGHSDSFNKYDKKCVFFFELPNSTFKTNDVVAAKMINKM